MCIYYMYVFVCVCVCDNQPVRQTYRQIYRQTDRQLCDHLTSILLQLICYRCRYMERYHVIWTCVNQFLIGFCHESYMFCRLLTVDKRCSLVPLSAKEEIVVSLNSQMALFTSVKLFQNVQCFLCYRC